MFGLFSSAKKVERNIILDIQSGLVRGVLVEEGEKTPLTIIGTAHKSVSKKSALNGEELSKEIGMTASSVAEALARGSEGAVSNISYVLSSPWIFSKLKIAQREYAKKTKVTSKTIKELAKEEYEAHHTDIQPVDQKIFEIRFDGEEIDRIHTAKVKKVEVSLATSFAQKSFLDSVKHQVSRHVMTEKSTFHSALLLKYLAFRESLGQENFIYLHVHDELTDGFIVKDGVLRHLASFPFGIKTLLRKISSKSNSSIESTHSLTSLFQEGKFSEKEHERMQTLIVPAIHEWGNMCVGSFEAMKEEGLPEKIYLCIPGYFELFKTALIFHDEYNFAVQQHEDDVEMYALALRNML